MKNVLYRKFYLRWKASGPARYFKRRRFDFTDRLLGGLLSQRERPARVLEVGCSFGADFLQLAAGNPALELYGLDPVEKEHFDSRFTFIKGYASKIDFPDGYFDAVVSYGVLEHIQPMEELCASAREIARVSKRYCLMVPAVSTLFEPHMASFGWQLRGRRRKKPHPALNYLSDDAWLKFGGFADARTTRFRYMPMITNLVIYRTGEAPS